MALTSDLLCQIFFRGWRIKVFPYACYGLGKEIEVYTQVSWPVFTVIRKVGSFWSICFHSQHWWILVCICSLEMWWRIHLKQTYLTYKLFCRMQNVDSFEMLVEPPYPHMSFNSFFARLSTHCQHFDNLQHFLNRPGLEANSLD